MSCGRLERKLDFDIWCVRDTKYYFLPCRWPVDLDHSHGVTCAISMMKVNTIVHLCSLRVVSFFRFLLSLDPLKVSTSLIAPTADKKLLVIIYISKVSPSPATLALRTTVWRLVLPSDDSKCNYTASCKVLPVSLATPLHHLHTHHLILQHLLISPLLHLLLNLKPQDSV